MVLYSPCTSGEILPSWRCFLYWKWMGDVPTWCHDNWHWIDRFILNGDFPWFGTEEFWNISYSKVMAYTEALNNNPILQDTVALFQWFDGWRSCPVTNFHLIRLKAQMNNVNDHLTINGSEPFRFPHTVSSRLITHIGPEVLVRN